MRTPSSRGRGGQAMPVCTRPLVPFLCALTQLPAQGDRTQRGTRVPMLEARHCRTKPDHGQGSDSCPGDPPKSNMARTWQEWLPAPCSTPSSPNAGAGCTRKNPCRSGGSNWPAARESTSPAQPLALGTWNTLRAHTRRVHSQGRAPAEQDLLPHQVPRGQGVWWGADHPCELPTLSPCPAPAPPAGVTRLLTAAVPSTPPRMQP